MTGSAQQLARVHVYVRAGAYARTPANQCAHSRACLVERGRAAGPAIQAHGASTSSPRSRGRASSRRGSSDRARASSQPLLGSIYIWSDVATFGEQSGWHARGAGKCESFRKRTDGTEGDV
eukprot:5431582-Pleurochrysis_carterae.AAC.5